MLLDATWQNAPMVIICNINIIFSTLRCRHQKQHLPALPGNPIPELQDLHGLLKIHLWVKMMPKLKSGLLSRSSVEFKQKWKSRITYSFLVHKKIISAVKRVDFVTDRMPYIMLRGCWCNIIVLNVHATTDNKIDNLKDRFCEELEQVFDKFPKYRVKSFALISLVI
jgi:hypothetical protein